MTGSTQVSLCLICNASCLSLRNSMQIFTANSQPDEVHLPTVLEQLLDTPITNVTAHSPVICKKCYKLVVEFDEIQSRVTDIKNEISNHYIHTLEKHEQGKEQLIDEHQENTNEQPIQVRSVNNFITQRAISGKMAKQEMLPKTILDIPSSDDELSQVGDKPLQEIEDIEMELEKIHEEGENVGDEHSEMQTGDQSVHSFDNSDLEDAERNIDMTGKMQYLKVNMETQKSDVETVETSTVDTVLTDQETKRPNILRKKSSNIQVENIIIQEPVDKFQKVTESSEESIVHRDGEMYTCLACEGETTVAGAAKAIIIHMRNAHQLRLYICDICGLDFRKRNLLSQHVDEHVANEEGDFQCEVCNRIFTNLRLFRIHRRMHLPQAKFWVCIQCKKKYSSKNLLDEHMNTHLGVRPYVCTICWKGFASKYTFRAHEKTHETRPRNFKCRCGKSFLSQHNLIQHEKTHSGIKEYQCHLCDKQFGSIHNLEVHSIVHTGYKPFICGLCGKAFARKAEIRDHERTHTGERPFQCEFCGATFSQRSNLQSHKRATHYDDKRYKCEICNKSFKRRRLLDYHMKAVHTGERPYKCDICDSTFVYPEHYKKHRRIHTGEKPYICEVCGKAFNSRDNRNAHRFIHSDKKPYECLGCGAGFMRKPQLYQHMHNQNHVNDTIVINQPRLTLDDKVSIGSERYLVTMDSNKVPVDGEDDSDNLTSSNEKINFAEESSENEDPGEIMDDIQQAITAEEGNYEEVLSADALTGETQIIETEDGPIQLMKVMIPNENGEQEEAWIKIVPDTELEELKPMEGEAS